MNNQTPAKNKKFLLEGFFHYKDGHLELQDTKNGGMWVSMDGLFFSVIDDLCLEFDEEKNGYPERIRITVEKIK